MNINISLSNIDLNPKNIQKIRSAVSRGMSRGLRDAGRYIVNEVKKEMDLPKTGNTYIFYKSRSKIKTQKSSAIRNSRASESGAIFRYPAPKGLKIGSGSSYTHRASNSSGLESSAVLTGELKKSVYTKSSGANQQIIGATAKHASIQEYGSKRVKARNNISRPLAQNKTNIANKIQNAINNNLKGL